MRHISTDPHLIPVQWMIFKFVQLWTRTYMILHVGLSSRSRRSTFVKNAPNPTGTDKVNGHNYRIQRRFTWNQTVLDSPTCRVWLNIVTRVYFNNVSNDGPKTAGCDRTFSTSPMNNRTWSFKFSIRLTERRVFKDLDIKFHTIADCGK